MNKQSAEEQLKKYSETLGVSMRDLRQLVLNVFIEDENYVKRINEARSQQVQSKQLALLDVQLRNRGMKEVLLQDKLARLISRKNRRDRIKKFFTFKKSKA